MSDKIFRKQIQLNKLETISKKTLKLLNEYHKAGFHIPFGLKGNIGEFSVAIELMKKFPKSKIDFRGGSHPGVDIFIDDIKIQVKTSYGYEIKQKNGNVILETCPTIKKDVIEKNRCDFIVLVVMYLADDYSKIKKQNIYVFGKRDFKYFKTILCWSGQSRGDFTIANIIKVNGKLTGKLIKKIKVYDTEKYKKLFEDSRNNWEKLKLGKKY